MTHADIKGLNKCVGHKCLQDEATMDVWAAIEAKFPGAHKFISELRGGEPLYVPQELERPRERVQRVDDGEMPAREVAALVGVSERTVWRARKEKAGCDPGSLCGQ